MIANVSEYRRAARRFSRNPLSLLGAVIVAAIVLSAIFAPYVAPYPQHAGVGVNFIDANLPPNQRYWLGTDGVGRDVLSRVVFGLRHSLMLGLVVVVLSTVMGTVVGLVAGYLGGFTETVLMRVTDVFLAIPSLVLALAVLGISEPSQVMAMVAVAVAYWPWQARLIYGLVKSLKQEGFVVAAQVLGASKTRIMFGEILPNCVPNIVTKASMDMGLVILLGASLSYLGLGAPPPSADLGTMVYEGGQLLPDSWWLCTAAGGAIFMIVIGFNLMADGLRDLFDILG